MQSKPHDQAHLRSNPSALPLPRFVILASTLIGCLCITSIGSAQDTTLLQQIEAANIQVIAKAEPSVVAIARVRKDVALKGGIESRLRRSNFDRSDRPGQRDFVPNDFGAGVIIDSQNARHPRLILTNFHVVRGGPIFGQSVDAAKFDLWVTIANRRPFKASIVAADPHSDLAVITVGELNPDEVSGLKPTVAVPKKGQFVFALGNPYTIAKDGSASATWGIVSNVTRSRSVAATDLEDEFRLFENVHQFGTLIQIGVALPIGTSGGALLNMKGELIGITTSLAPLNGYEQSAGYAIPFTPGFARVVKELSAGYEVEYGFLGIRPADATIEDFDGLRPAERPRGGAVALSVTANAPAARGGIAAGDVIIGVNNIAINHSGDLMREVALVGPNQKAKMKIWRPRAQEFSTRTASLGKWPVQNDTEIIATAYRLPPWRGIRFDYPTARLRYLRAGGTVAFEPGVLITLVDEERHGLKIQAGDFIARVGNTQVRTPAEFNAAVTQLGETDVSLETTDGRTIQISP